MTVTKPQVAMCPTCDTRIRFHEVPSSGDLLRCPECGACLEVIKSNPLELDWAADDDEWCDPIEEDRSFFSF